MKKLLFTAILTAFASHICGQSILIERVLFSTPNEINILSIDRNQGKVYFTSPSRPGLLYTDLRTNKVILDSTLSNLELSGFTKLNPAYSLLQMPDRSFYLANSINGALTPIENNIGSEINLPELQYDDTRDIYYGLLNNKIIECKIDESSILSVDTVKAFEGITLTAVHAFNGDQFYSIRDSQNKNYIAKGAGDKIQRLRYPINYGESADEIAVLNSDSIIVSRRLRQGEHQLALIYASEIISQLDTIEVRKIKEVETTQVDSVVDQTYIPFNEFTAERNRDIGKGRFATIIDRTTDALKAMVSLNSALRANPNSFSYKKDSVYFVLGPKREVKYEAEQDSVFFSRKGIVTRTFDFEYDTIVNPADVVLRLKCIDKLTGFMPGYRVDFYEYESNTVVNSTQVLPEEVSYLSYFPDYTLGITVTSPRYLPHSMKVDPSVEYKTSRQTEKIVFLESALAQTVREVTRDETLAGVGRYSPSATNSSNVNDGRDPQEVPTSPLEAGGGGYSPSATNSSNVNDGRDQQEVPAAPLETVAKGKPIILKNVFFDFDSDRLSEVAKRELKLVYESQKEAKTLTIIGHTDSKGTASYNQGLSERRAAAVGTYMISLGFKGDLVTIGKGESSPIASNETETGRGKNRRVEIVINY